MIMDRRDFLAGCIGVGICSLLPKLAYAKNQSQLIHQLGLSLPQANKIQRIVSAGGPADSLLMALCPEKLLGYANQNPAALIRAGLTNPIFDKPKLGRLSGKNTLLSLESLLQLQPDLIVDCGNVSNTHLSLAHRLQQLTGINTLLIDGNLQDSAAQLQQLGQVLGLETRANILAEKANNILNNANHYAATHNSKSFYFARSPNGQQTGLSGSIHTQAIEVLGLKNVAQSQHFYGLAQVSMEQIIQWDPDLIITQEPLFAQHIQHHPVWRSLRAIKTNQLLVFSNQPFGWLDTPPGINRLLGLQYLQNRLLNISPQQVELDVQQFFEHFYQSQLSLPQVRQLLAI